MHDVAKHIGVSPMTVSRVLNGDPRVSRKTRERVQTAVKALGYAPNPAARSLAAARTRRIALIYSNPSAAYLNELLVGLLGESSHQECQLVLEQCSQRGQAAAMEKILDDGLDGILLPPPLAESSSVVGLLRNRDVPFVTIGTLHAPSEDLSVCIDNVKAARAMTRYLLSLGHRDIGFIRGPRNHAASTHRYQGFLATLGEHGLEPRPDRVRPGAFTYRSGLRAANELLARANRPTAIFASNDDMAAAAIATAHRFHIEVPGDLTVVGFDDTPLATAMWPSLTTIRQPIARMASKALALLLEEIRLRAFGQRLPRQLHELKFSLVRRESSAPI